MISGAARDKILKSWAGVPEVALIKEVATKGEHIQLCIEFWAHKRKQTVAEYQLFFHDVVQTYVHRLLSERLVCKAENVLRNVQRDVRCCFYQFACECVDAKLQEMVLEHLRRKGAHAFVQDLPELQFNWELLQQVQACPATLAKCKTELRRNINLETLMTCEPTFYKRLEVELYFANRSVQLLPRLDKLILWQFLVETQQITEIVRWCYLSTTGAEGDDNCTELELKYVQWAIEVEMFEHALRTLHGPSEVVRNCFARAGYFFADERDEVPLVLRRICSTESFEKNREVMEKLPVGRFLLQQRLYTLMLRDFVSIRELEELAEEYLEHSALLKLVLALKENDMQKRVGFEQIAQATKTYLEGQEVNFDSTQPLVTLFDFLSNEPTVASLNCFLLSSALKLIPYLKAMSQRLESNSIVPTLPSSYDFLRKFKQIDFKEICKDRKEQLASFSNERLCQKYARKYELNFLHYLKQQRSAFAVYYLLTEQLQHYAQITKAQLFNASEAVTELALQHVNNTPLVTHCVAFIEMLGFDTQQLRNFLILCRLLDTATISDDGSGTQQTHSYAGLVAQVEHILLERLEQEPNQFPLTDYQAVMRIVACDPQRQWPQLILRRYASKNDWWRLLVLLQYFNVPLGQVQQLLGHFSVRTVGEHLLRALSHEMASTAERINCKWRASATRQQAARQSERVALTTSIETMASSLSSYNDGHLFSSAAQHQQLLRLLPDTDTDCPDLFAIVLLSSSSLPTAEQCINSGAKFLELLQDNQHCSTAVNLLKNCVKFRLPVLALLAATVSASNIAWNWLVWLAVSTNQWQEVLRLAEQDVHELCWLLIDNCVRLGYTNTLYRSFCIFLADNPVVHLFRFLQYTQNHRDFSDGVVHELRLFLLAWSNDEIQLPLFTAPLKREQIMLRCMKLLLVHLQHNFDSTLEQQSFLSSICRSDMGDICGGWLDFCQLQRVFDVMQAVPGGNWSQRFPINFEELIRRDSKAYKQLLAALLEAKQHDVAIRLASLMQLPINDIVYSKWVVGLEQEQNIMQQQQQLTFQSYEQEIAEHSLPPELLVHFYLYAASRLSEPSSRKYQLLKLALNVIKRHHLFPDESFDRDEIEYEMVLCYLQVADEELERYHSEYYEQIMVRERCVLYKSFLELKMLAGIDDLNVSSKTPLTPNMLQRLDVLLNGLLDEGDLIEALRLQEMFECRPIDLRFVVFCMALAEGVTTICSMSSEERQMLRDVEKSSFARFNRRTLGTMRNSGSQQGHSSPLKSSSSNNYDLSDSSSTLEFEEIPSKERRETLDTIQGIASKLKYGVELGRRVVMAYRAAMYLDKEYLDVLRTKDVSVLLKSVSEDGGCLHRLLVVSDILTSTQMTAVEIAELLAYELTTAVIRPRFYIFSVDQQSKNNFKNADLWGYNIDRDIHLFLELTPSTTRLGHFLLEYCDALKAFRKFQDNKPFERNQVFDQLAEIIMRYGMPASATSISCSPTGTSLGAFTAAPPQVLSHKKQNLIYVELLIKAHECFMHECYMEGIALVLHRAKALSAVLTKTKSWSLIVRLLIGLARYREMFYCFDALIEHGQFESLLGQFDEEKAVGLRQAILTYLREYRPEDGKEFLKLAALHFLMYKDLAEMWEQEALAVVNIILATAQLYPAQLQEQHSMNSLTSAIVVAKVCIPKLRSSAEVLSLLQQALENYSHATENYLLDNKLLLAQKSASRAEMVAVQIDLMNKALERNVIMQQPHCVCLINVQSRDDFRELVNSELSVPQAMILSRAKGYDINWAETLLSQYIILKKRAYLEDYLTHLPINDSLIDNIVKGFQLYAQHHKPTVQMEQHLAQLVELVKSVTLKYKLASLLALKSTVMSLLNDHTLYYLRDTNYGRNESDHNMSDI